MFPIGFLEFGIKDFIETLIIALSLVYLYRWVKGTFAIQAAIGILFVIIINVIIGILGFNTINTILSQILDVGVIAVIILFQPEIRKLLYRLGTNTNLDRFFSTSSAYKAIDEVVDAVKELSKNKIGALIVFARTSSLQDLVDAGVNIDADVKSELIVTIFRKETPLHDGAIVIRGNRIVAASCYLPISQNPNISNSFGTRHRAAVGISETNNVFVLVVSEETGRISVARNGALTSGLTIQKLRAEMEDTFGTQHFDEDVAFTSAQTDMNLN
ncbi:MAG: TIGR00159 family protein [Balneolaceae bacterium]|nr:TIGR00159 family protein [Balneolaceae bacterium]